MRIIIAQLLTLSRLYFACPQVENADLLKPWQLAREKYKQRKRLVGDREKATLARLKHFSDAIKKMPAAGVGSSAKAPEEDVLGEPTATDEGYSGKVRTDIDHKEYLPPSWRVRQ